MLEDIDPDATILLALSKDRKYLHFYSALDEEGRIDMIETLKTDPAILEELKNVFNVISNILGNTVFTGKVVMNNDKVVSIRDKNGFDRGIGHEGKTTGYN